MAAATEQGEIAALRVADDHHVAATTAVAPVGAPPGHVSLATEADHAVTATTALYIDLRSVEEHAADEVSAAVASR
jgi:hypothetical protein